MDPVLLELILVQNVDHFIVIIIRHELGLDRLISATSNSPFEDLPSRLLPLGQYHSWHFYQPVQESRLFLLLNIQAISVNCNSNLTEISD